MSEHDTLRPNPLAVVRHFLPLLPAADGTLGSHWDMARALCAVAEDVLRRARPAARLLPPWELAEVAAGTDELGRLLLLHLPFRSAAARQAWPQVQTYLLRVVPAIEYLLVAGSPSPEVT